MGNLSLSVLTKCAFIKKVCADFECVLVPSDDNSYNGLLIWDHIVAVMAANWYVLINNIVNLNTQSGESYFDEDAIEKRLNEKWNESKYWHRKIGRGFNKSLFMIEKDCRDFEDLLNAGFIRKHWKTFKSK